MIPYTYISSPDFINNLSFNYIETYSFQRGSEFEESKKINQLEFNTLNAKKANNLTNNEANRLEELKLLGNTQYLLNENGFFHPSCKKTNTFSFNDPETGRVKNILLTKITEIPMWLCSPIYRDAIVFYNKKNEIITTLNVCLSCRYMETTMFNHINGDNKTYDLLKEFFIEIGHEVEISN